jgi:nicotinamidase-related amidase
MTDAGAVDEHTRGVYRDAGFTGSFALGERPAVLVVDFSRGFTDPACPLGFDATPEVERTRAVLDAARSCGAVVVFTTIAYDEGSRLASTWLRKVPSLGSLVPGSPWVDIDERLGRTESEPVVAKGGASAFFGTPVHALLVGHRVDTVFVLGATTSGCVRASVVDAVQHGFPTFVVQDCCADRSLGPHEANLFDMTAKYADGCTSEEVVRYLNGLSSTEAG